LPPKTPFRRELGRHERLAHGYPHGVMHFPFTGETHLAFGWMHVYINGVGRHLNEDDSHWITILPMHQTFIGSRYRVLQGAALNDTPIHEENLGIAIGPRRLRSPHKTGYLYLVGIIRSSSGGDRQHLASRVAT